MQYHLLPHWGAVSWITSYQADQADFFCFVFIEQELDGQQPFNTDFNFILNKNVNWRCIRMRKRVRCFYDTVSKYRFT